MALEIDRQAQWRSHDPFGGSLPQRRWRIQELRPGADPAGFSGAQGSIRSGRAASQSPSLRVSVEDFLEGSLLQAETHAQPAARILLHQ